MALEGPVICELPAERRLLGVHQLARRAAARDEHTALVDAATDRERAAVGERGVAVERRAEAIREAPRLQLVLNKYATTRVNYSLHKQIHILI